MNFIYLINAQFKNMTVINNKANVNNGGGILIISSKNIIFEESIFENNYSYIGAGLYLSNVN